MQRTLVLWVLMVFAVLSKPVNGQTVQLPTINVFSVNTTVSVPDRGSVYLGGVDRASYGSSSQGVPGLSRLPGLGRLFGNRGIGSELSSSRAYASVTIMDLEELDRRLLAEAAAGRGAAAAAAGSGVAATSNPAVARKAAFLAKHIARNDRSRFASPGSASPGSASPSSASPGSPSPGKAVSRTALVRQK